MVLLANGSRKSICVALKAWLPEMRILEWLTSCENSSDRSPLYLAPWLMKFFNQGAGIFNIFFFVCFVILGSIFVKKILQYLDKECPREKPCLIRFPIVNHNLSWRCKMCHTDFYGMFLPPAMSCSRPVQTTVVMSFRMVTAGTARTELV